LQGSLFQTLLLLSPVFTLARVASPTKCELAIVRCCERGSARVLPLRCFEVNGCPGLYWFGYKVCSASLVARAQSSVNNISRVGTESPNTTNTDDKKTVSAPPIVPKKKRPKPSLPTACELSVVRCCGAKHTTTLPLRCFEVNGCPGLYWHGKRTCSPGLVSSAIATLNRKIRRRKKMKGTYLSDTN